MTIMLIALVLSGVPQGDVKPPKPSENTTAVRGCVKGHSLKTTQSDILGLGTATYKLHLSKSPAKALREHDGHEEEFTGVVEQDVSGRSMGGEKATAIGKTKITVGAREERNTGERSDPELKVESFRHISATCDAPG